MARTEAFFAEERKKEILNKLNNDKKIIVPELSALFGVSATTIRKDLKELEAANLLLRTHGGAISISKTGFEQLPAKKEGIMAAEKKAIARSALDFIQDGDTIALMTGTTVMELVKLLGERSKLRIVVNDLRFATYLEQYVDCDLYMLSGLIRKNYHYITSPIRCEMLSMMNIDKAFITCNGFTADSGATTPDMENALKIREVLAHTDATFLLCDSSKIGSRSFAQIAKPEEIDYFITDDGITEDDAMSLSGKMQTVIAKTRPADKEQLG